MQETGNQGSNERMVKRSLFDKVRATIGRVPFARQALAAYCCATDPRTPKRVKAVLIAALAYFIMPIDAIPDIIAGLGFSDDAAVFWAAWNSVRSHINPRHLREADDLLVRLSGQATQDDGKQDQDVA